jgi:SAM-dependent methyltransferase
MADNERYRREAEFHDRTFVEHSRSQLGRFYSITGASRGYYKQLITRGCATKTILEYGCGPGSYGVHLAELGGHVTGIDISPVAIAMAKESSVDRGLDVAWRVMNAEALDLPDATFDLVCGSAILHHLDLSRALPEVKRVLKPSGRAVFYEALGHNPIINWYRRRTPHLRSRDEHPLREADFRLLRGHFDRVSVRTFHLTTLAAVPLRNSRAFPKVVSALDAFDRGLFRAIPMLGKHAWSCVIEASLTSAPAPSEAR